MNTNVAGVLLAGGLSRRMGGGDKGFRAVGGVPIIERAMNAAKPQVAALVLNANGDPARFAGFGLPVAADVVGGFAGPLAGILTGLEWARINVPSCSWVLSIPTDAPFLPADLVARMMARLDAEGAELACARSGDQIHPVIGLWPVRLADDLRKAMVDEDMRKIDRWTARYRIAVADWPTEPYDPFFNVNTPDDVAEAERVLTASF